MLDNNNPDHWVVLGIVPTLGSIKWSVYEWEEIGDKIDWLDTMEFRLEKSLKEHPEYRDELQSLLKYVRADRNRWREQERLLASPAQQVVSLPTEKSEEIDIHEVSRLTGYTLGTLRHMCSSKYKGQHIPHYKRGRHVYFKRSEVAEWMTEHKVELKEQKDSRELLEQIVQQRRRG